MFSLISCRQPYFAPPPPTVGCCTPFYMHWCWWTGIGSDCENTAALILFLNKAGYKKKVNNICSVLKCSTDINTESIQVTRLSYLLWSCVLSFPLLFCEIVLSDCLWGTHVSQITLDTSFFCKPLKLFIFTTGVSSYSPVSPHAS